MLLAEIRVELLSIEQITEALGMLDIEHEGLAARIGNMNKIPLEGNDNTRLASAFIFLLGGNLSAAQFSGFELFKLDQNVVVAEIDMTSSQRRY